MEAANLSRLRRMLLKVEEEVELVTRLFFFLISEKRTGVWDLLMECGNGSEFEME